MSVRVLLSLCLAGACLMSVAAAARPLASSTGLTATDLPTAAAAGGPHRRLLLGVLKDDDARKSEASIGGARSSSINAGLGTSATATNGVVTAAAAADWTFTKGTPDAMKTNIARPTSGPSFAGPSDSSSSSSGAGASKERAGPGNSIDVGRSLDNAVTEFPAKDWPSADSNGRR